MKDMDSEAVDAEVAALLASLLHVVQALDPLAPDDVPPSHIWSADARRLLRVLIEFDQRPRIAAEAAADGEVGAAEPGNWPTTGTGDWSDAGAHLASATSEPWESWPGTTGRAGDAVIIEDIPGVLSVADGPPPRSADRGEFPDGGAVAATDQCDDLRARVPAPPRKIAHLPNARVGVPYVGSLHVAGLRRARLLDGKVLGLEFDETAMTLHGVPSESGDFTITVGGEIDGQMLEVSLRLAVIPDPKSLWVSRPSDPQAAFWKPDEESKTIVDELYCLGASKRGRSHAQDGGCRDDDFGLAMSDDGWYIAAVADGAGSARFSRQGSRMAVEAILERLPGLLAEHLSPFVQDFARELDAGSPAADLAIKKALYATLATAAFEAAQTIEKEARRYEKSASNFNTTLLIVIVKRISRGWFVAGFGIGDGGAAIYDGDLGRLTPLTFPDSGEFAGQTRFLDISEFMGGFSEVQKRVFYAAPEKFTAIALMTDGITDPKFPTEMAMADPHVWKSFWLDDVATSVELSRDNSKAGTQLLNWLDFWSPGNHDDRTIVLLIP